MNDAAPAQSGTEVATEQQAPETEATPPWGSNEEFNPEKAWNLVKNLRSDLADAKSKLSGVSELEAKVKEFEDAQLSESERAAKELADAQAASGELATENAILKAVIKHGLSEEDVELLAGLPADDIPDRAAKLAARLGAGTPPKPLATRPTEALRGGADPTQPITQDGDWLRNALASGRD